MFCFLLITLNNGGNGITSALTQLDSWFGHKLYLQSPLRNEEGIALANHTLSVVRSGAVRVGGTDHLAVWYQAILHRRDACADPAREASLVLFSFQEASLNGSPASYDRFGGLPFIVDTYSQGCSSDYVKKMPENTEALSTHGLIQLAFGEKECLAEEFVRGACAAEEEIESVPIRNYNDQPVVVKRRNKFPRSGWISFQKVFDKFGESSRQTHTSALLFPLRLPVGGESVSLVFAGAHLTFSPNIGGHYPSLLNCDIRREQIRLIREERAWKDVPLLLIGDLNMRTRPRGFDGWESKSGEQIVSDFRAMDWVFPRERSFPVLEEADFVSDMTWSDSNLWKNSEGYENFAQDRTAVLIAPNFPPTYQFGEGEVKQFAILKTKNEKVYDLRPPSWTEQLLVLDL